MGNMFPKIPGEYSNTREYSDTDVLNLVFHKIKNKKCKIESVKILIERIPLSILLDLRDKLYFLLVVNTSSEKFNRNAEIYEKVCSTISVYRNNTTVVARSPPPYGATNNNYNNNRNNNNNYYNNRNNNYNNYNNVGTV
jgi:hypothetical protein